MFVTTVILLAMTLDLTTFVAILASAFVGLLIYLQNVYSFWSRRNIPGPKPNFLLGNFNEIRKECHLIYHKRWIKQFGKVYGIFDLSRPKLIVADADLIKSMLVKDFNSLSDRRDDGWDHPMEQNFSFIQESEKWKKTRGVMTSSFTLSKFKNIFEQMNICSTKLVSFVDELVASGKANDIDAMDVFKNYFGDIISRSMFSLSFIDSYSEEDRVTNAIIQYFHCSKFKQMLSFILPRWLRRAMKMSMFRMDALDYPISLFREIVRQRSQKKQQQVDMLQQWVDNAAKVNFGEDAIVSNLILLYAAGMHSSTLTLSYLIYIISKYPRVRENIVKEIEDFESSGEPLTVDTVTNGFKYMEAVLNEILRLYPPSTYTERKVSANEYSFEFNDKKYTVPKGTIIYFPTFLVHRDPEYFKNPEKFDESRFLPENKGHLHPYAFLPFGHGPRSCIGIRFAMTSVKLIAIKIVKKYKFELANEKIDPMDDFTDTVDELLINKPIRIKIQKCE